MVTLLKKRQLRDFTGELFSISNRKNGHLNLMLENTDFEFSIFKIVFALKNACEKYSINFINFKNPAIQFSLGSKYGHRQSFSHKQSGMK